MKKELVSIFVIAVMVTGFLDSSLILGFSVGKPSTDGSSCKSLEDSVDQTLPNGGIGSNWPNCPSFWWAGIPGNRPFSDLRDPLLGWNSDDAGKWTDLAYVNGNETRLIVGVDSRNDASFTQVAGLAVSYDGRVVDAIKIKQQVKALVVELPLTSARAFAGNAYGLSSVRYVEPNAKVQAECTPNDADWSLQWGPQKIQADWAWNTTKGSSKVLVAVVDTGINYSHPDIAPNYFAGGYDWVNNDTSPMDDNGHGTHCAGIIAAVTNNSIGIAGIAQVHVMAEKVLDDWGSGYWDSVANGIINATDCGASIISMSLGGYYDSELVHDAIRYAYNAGVLIVAAAGNSATDEKHYPAAYDEAVAVAATYWNDTTAWFSNWGKWIELAAPGVDIYSTILNGYANKSGTSMACPHVSGVAALAWSMYGNKSRDWIRAWLRYTADDLGDPGFDNYYGYGRVNARSAVEQAIPEHGIMLVDLKKPRYDEPGVSQYINTTVLNLGANDEDDVDIQLIVNGSLTDTTHVSLGNGTSTKVSFQWTPASLGKHNVTVYAVPVTGETITADNIRSGWISVQNPLIRPIPGQWAAYTITTFSPYYRRSYTYYLNITYDHFVEPYVMYVTESIRYPNGYTYVYWMTVNTMDRRVEDSYGDYWFYGWIETDVKMGSTVNLESSNATVDESKYISYGIYPIDCWGLSYATYYVVPSHYYYDKTSGLFAAYDYESDGYRVEYLLTSSNIMKIPSYEHELVVTLDAPLYLARGNSTVLNATVYNIGSNTENNAELSLLVGGSEAKHVTIPALQNGASYNTSYLWTPTSEAVYSWSASVQPLVDETYLGNNVANRSVTVSHPLFSPVEGEHANYLIRYGEPIAHPGTFSYSLNLTYLRYISPYQMNITVAVHYLDPEYTYSGWWVVNTFTRIVEFSSVYYWSGSLFVGWIGTDVTLGSVVGVGDYNGTVVGNKVIYVGGRFIDCWEILVRPPYYTGSYSDVFWYDKASGLLLGEVESMYGDTRRLELLETDVSLGSMCDNDLTMAIESMGMPVVGSKVTLNATVYNIGLGDETDIHLQLMIDGVTADRWVIDQLPSSRSCSLNHAWVPTRVGNYSISVYADPVSGEDHVANNAASRFLNISSQFYKRMYIAHQWVGDEVPTYSYGDYPYEFHYMQFSFPFYGQSRQWMYISADGLIAFDYPSYDYNHNIDELTALPAIAPAWGNWTTLGLYGISMWENSTEIHVMWYVGAKSNDSITATFEVILDAEGRIQFNYGSNNGRVPALIGISDGVSRMRVEYAEDLNYTRSIVFTPDSTAPPAITDLRFGGSTQELITLVWTAPGDDDLNGSATGYIVKYSTLGPINDTNWEIATTYDQSWIALPANSTEKHELSGFSRYFRYWFAVKTCDGVPNYSEISNSPSGFVPVSGAVVLVTSITAIVVPLMVVTAALADEARARAADARRRALRLRRWRASLRRRSKLRSATVGNATEAQPKSQ